MILILGGARSGKSKFAAKLAKRLCDKIAYIATAPVCDLEMQNRVRAHRKARPKDWFTIESQKDMVSCLKKIPKSCNGIMIECIGTYVSDLMMHGLSDSEIIKDISAVLKKIKRLNKKIFIVSNEVGSGLVPETELGRRFRDVVGNANQLIARQAREVYLVLAGLHMRLK